jgi:trans-aconitate 2-methyltransferase
MQDILTQNNRYTFGHSPTAAERLRIIADFFNPLAAEMICNYMNKEVISAADMGCGPGYTTDMIACATRSQMTSGFDISSYFIGLARENYPLYTFIQDDVTQFDDSNKFDFIYCRFLLSHLKNIKAIVESWMKLLTPEGILFIDELEGIETEVPVFKKYLRTNQELIASQNSELFIGSQLNAVVKGHNLLDNRSDLIPVADSLAARWFYPNTVSIWKEDAFVRSRIDEAERVKISDELAYISQSTDINSHITWKMKRILLTT